MLDAQTILITGGAGNIGTKLAAALGSEPWVRRITIADMVPAKHLPPKAETLIADFSKPDGGWLRAAEQADTIVHLAAASASPHSGWAEAQVSFDMTAMLLEAATKRDCRFLFGSSNHVMGKYKEANLGPGELTVTLPPEPGTIFLVDGAERDRQAYGATKLMGERALLAAAAAPGSRLTGVAMRIGWCQPGQNHPRTITAGESRVVTEVGATPHVARDLRWFRNMWLSNRDLVGMFLAAITADASNWPARGIVLNCVSGNKETPWDLEPSREWLGYAPVDDVWDVLSKEHAL